MKILYVEDNAESRMLVRRILEAQGYEVVEAEDGLSAVRLAEKEAPDLILVDINIPGLDGFEVTTRLRSIPSLERVPIVALTASAVMKGDRERTLVAGCDGYLQKPVDVDTLPAQIAAYLAGMRERVPPEEEVRYLREYSHRLVSRLEQKVAELQRAHEQLQVLDRLKSEFVSTVSHELRTPLTAIKGYAHLLIDGTAGPLTPEQRDALRTILESTEQVIRRVNDILFLQESSQIVPSRTPVSLREVALLAIRLVEPHASDAGVEILAEIPEDVRIVGDTEALELLFLHLLDNAIKFSPGGGKVRVRIEDTGQAVYGEVSDTGIGIAPEHHERIFEPFYQVDSSSTRVFGGAGLGLAISKRIVEAHGGWIGVRSSPGQGSTFYFTLPKGKIAESG
ncbi:MAG: sensor histidine kinase [Chloroflexia bacterium]